MREQIEAEINYLIESDGYVGQDKVIQYVLNLYQELLNENEVLKERLNYLDKNLRIEGAHCWNNKILDQAKEMK